MSPPLPAAAKMKRMLSFLKPFLENEMCAKRVCGFLVLLHCAFSCPFNRLVFFSFFPLLSVKQIWTMFCFVSSLMLLRPGRRRFSLSSRSPRASVRTVKVSIKIVSARVFLLLLLLLLPLLCCAFFDSNRNR